MNKKISYGCLIFCMALYSVDGFAARRNTTRANTTTKTRSSSLISGYNNKFFKSPSVTLVEKRSVELEPLLFTENIANIKQTLNGEVAVDSKYRLCIPCENIYLTYNDGVINESLKGDSQGEGNCYSLNAETPNEYYKLAVKSGAIEACGDKLRMTILDMRNKDVHTEIDSVVLNIVPNSSAYDYSNIQLGQDTEIYELIDNYTMAKQEAKLACDNGIKSHLNAFKKALVGTTTVSAITTATGAADTALQIANTVGTDSKEGENELNGKEIASAALSGTSAAGNITTMAISISVAKQVDGLLDDLKKCKVAAEKMHAAGMALEAGLEEITSADE